MTNLLKETLDFLKSNNKKESDILYCCGDNFKFTWENFKNVSNVDYDSGFGSPEVALDLKIVGNNFWLERHEYDGSEWWEFKEFPNYDNEEYFTVKAVTSREADRLRGDSWNYYGNLLEMNNW